MSKKVIIVDAAEGQQPLQRGCYTIALPTQFITGSYLAKAQETWIAKLLDRLGGASVFASEDVRVHIPDLALAPDEMMEINPNPRVVMLPTRLTQAVMCVDGRISDVVFQNLEGDTIVPFRFPGPDQEFINEIAEIIGNVAVVQHGHHSPVPEMMAGSEARQRGCAWRDAFKRGIGSLTWHYYYSHNDDGETKGVYVNPTVNILAA